MADERAPEYVGYRVNAKHRAEEVLGHVTVYAERRNEDTSLGEYGGDAYPVVYEKTKTEQGRELRYGVILAADGVGQGSYKHPSLQKYLSGQVTAGGERETSEKLSVFLRALYGNDIFSEKHREVLSYALRSFSSIPADGYFVAHPDRWKNTADNQQVHLPFYLRDSQSLGSRLTCVGLFLKFRDYFQTNELNPTTAAALRDEIEAYLQGELQERVKKLFDLSDATNTDKRNRYFLPCTVAMWFYLYDVKEKTVHALALNSGDARCYLIDTADGVRQISIDDAFPDGSMSSFVHFGAQPKLGGGYHDLQLRARLVKATAPCALVACSDGVYDTCPFELNTLTLHGKYSPTYGETNDPSDFLFEVNLLEALRRSYSFEDFRREVVFNFYAQRNARDFAEAGDAGAFPAVKRDDSGTLGARFFGENGDDPVALFEALRTSTTSLDKLRSKIEEAAGTIKIPYTPPHVTSSEEQEKAKWAKYASGNVFKGFALGFRAHYHNAYQSMVKAGAAKLWGREHTMPELTNMWYLNQYLSQPATHIAMLELAVKDWQWLFAHGGENGKIAPPEDWQMHEHVIFDKDVLAELEKIEFGKAVEELTMEVKDMGAERKLALYAHFERCLFGELSEDAHALICETEGARSVDLDKFDEIDRQYAPADVSPAAPDDKKGTDE